MHIALLCFNTYPVICSGVLREHALRYSLIFSRMLVVATYILCKCFLFCFRFFLVFVSFFLLSASCVVSLVCFAIFACWNNGEKKYSLKENYRAVATACGSLRQRATGVSPVAKLVASIFHSTNRALR